MLSEVCHISLVLFGIFIFVYSFSPERPGDSSTVMVLARLSFPLAPLLPRPVAPSLPLTLPHSHSPPPCRYFLSSTLGAGGSSFLALISD